jgi:hypothetical protein
MATPIKWEDADFLWDSNSYTWSELKLAGEVAEIINGPGEFDEEIYKYDAEKKRKLIKLILKVHGNTITESKKIEIKQYKITAKDIRLVVKKVLGTKIMAENISF